MERATEPVFYELDPCGDISLTLNESNVEYEDDEDFYTLPALPTQEEAKRTYTETFGYHSFLPLGSKTGRTGAGNDRWPVEGDLHEGSDTQESPARDDKHEEKDIQEEHATEPPPIRFRVSSKHLTLASPLFAMMLKPTWAEGVALNSQGAAEISALSSTRESLLVYLNAIHCRSQDIPWDISASQMCETAVLVDYYQSHDALRFYFDTWIKNQIGLRPGELSRDSIKWLFISWVFKKGDMFTSVARILQREAKAPLKVSKLPIPEKVIGKGEDENALQIPISVLNAVIDRINQSREASIGALIEGLHKILDEIRGDHKWCSFDCNTFSLRATLMNYMSWGIYSRPPPPYQGYSFSRLSTSLRYAEIPDPYKSNGVLPHRCRIESAISSLISNAESSISDLKLQDFS
ncbi:hypothetical protein FQN49_007815 [Arthroderma sp. PD_2]|nr:hypothetical protein FQN49_007815 [Arthroderma sp. PD_2]